MKIPSNVRIMMEVDSLEHATLATVSRCGMVWFAEDTVTVQMVLKQQLRMLQKHAIAFRDNVSIDSISSTAIHLEGNSSGFVEAIAPFFSSSPSVIETALIFAMEQQHIMDPSRDRLLGAFYSLLVRGLLLICEYDEAHPDFPMSHTHLESFSIKWLLFSALWGFGGSLNWNRRGELGTVLVKLFGVDMPVGRADVTELQVDINDGSWAEWAGAIPCTDIETHKVT